MRRRAFLRTSAATAAGAALPAGLTAQPSKASPFLGSWLHLQTLLRDHASRAGRERAIDEILDGHLAAGFRGVIPYITNTSGGAHFPSRVIRQQPAGDWDPLEYLIRGADKRGLEVYPAFCVLVSGHEEPSGILLEHPEWASRHPDGKPMGHICPTHPASRDWAASVIADVVKRYPTKGVMLDYLRYYNRPRRLDVASEKEFETWKKGRPDLSEKEAFQTFREEGISRLARQISETARALNPDLRIAIYSWGPHVAKNHLVAQPWPVWSREGWIDRVSVSGYCYPDNYGDKYLEVFSRRIGDAVKLNRSVGGRAEMSFTLGASTSHGKIRDAGWIGDYLSRAAEQGATGCDVFTWAYLQPHLKEALRRGFFLDFLRRVSA